MNYSQGDERCIKNTTYNTKMTSLDNSLIAINNDTIQYNNDTIDNTIQNISYDSSNNRINVQDVYSGTIYQVDTMKIIQATGSSTAYNYLQNTNVTNLNVTWTLAIPSGTTINGATYNSDIVLTDLARINQSGTGIDNKQMRTKKDLAF